MADMDKKEMEAAVESILFASGEPVNIERICVALAIDRPTAERILQGLMDYYAYERRGMRCFALPPMMGRLLAWRLKSETPTS